MDTKGEESEYNIVKIAFSKYKLFARDQFAMAAMQGIVTRGNFSIGDVQELSKTAYIIADAMLKQRDNEAP